MKSDSITRKFTDTIELSDYEILSDSGWVEATHLHKTIEYKEWLLVLESGISLICADDHIVFDESLSEVFVKELQIGNIILTQDGPTKVLSILELETSSEMFDITVSHPGHRYYTNSILSHNTTTATAIILHYILFNKRKTVGLLANKGDAAREILDRIKIAYEALPLWIQQGVIVWNKGSIELENGSKVIAAATSSTAVRGKTINLLYIDEAAFVRNWEEFFSSVYPTISSGKTTKILLTSTPNGLNHFWKLCKEAKEDINFETGEGKNGYKLIEVSWESIPGRDKEWMEKTLASMSFNIEQFNQEFCCSFIGSQNTLISGTALKNLSAATPIAKTPFLNQYYKPEPGHQYALVADVSRGKGLDYSAFSVVDVTKMPYVQVLTYRNNEILPTDYAAVVYQAAKLYNEAQVLVEINDIGGQVADILYMEYGYENLLFTENKGRSGKRISGGFGSNIDRGIRTTTSVKSMGCSLLKIMVEQQQLIVTDYETIEELKKFEKKGRSYEASNGSHDDLVMTLVLFSWLSDQGFFKDLTDINTMGNLRDKTEAEIESEMLPFGFNSHYDEQEIYF